VDELAQQSLQMFEPLKPALHGGWESARHCMWPQEVIIRLEARTQLQHILLISKENRSIPECQIYAGDAFNGSFYDCAYRHAGTATDVNGRQPKQFSLFGIGNYLKLVFTK